MGGNPLTFGLGLGGLKLTKAVAATVRIGSTQVACSVKTASLQIVCVVERIE